MEYEIIKDLEFMDKVAIPVGVRIKQEENGVFYLVYNNIQLTYAEEELKTNSEYFKLVDPDGLPDSISEVTEEATDPEIKKWRIQLDVTTDKSTLLEIDRKVKELVEKLINKPDVT